MWVACGLLLSGGLNAQVSVVDDIAKGDTGFVVSNFIEYSGELYFAGWNKSAPDTIGSELYKYDPVADTITLAANIFNYVSKWSMGSLPGNFAVFKGKLFFSANDGASGAELWSFDGTSAVLEADVRPGTSGSFLSELKNILLPSSIPFR